MPSKLLFGWQCKQIHHFGIQALLIYHLEETFFKLERISKNFEQSQNEPQHTRILGVDSDL